MFTIQRVLDIFIEKSYDIKNNNSDRKKPLYIQKKNLELISEGKLGG